MQVERDFGITISIGLSANKFLAKIASDLDKPRGFAVLGATEAVSFLASKPVGFIYGVGAVSAAKLAADGFRSIADLQRADERDLMETGSRKWGRPYLTREFFSVVGEKMRDRILLVMARRAGRWIAGAINFIGTNTLYGRNWGAIEHHPFLHFELCYYQAIDYAIARRLKRVEAGAQGEHKLARGYVPVPTWSAHYIPDRNFRRAIADFLARERAGVESDQQYLAQLTPFRRGEPCS